MNEKTENDKLDKYFISQLITSENRIDNILIFQVISQQSFFLRKLAFRYHISRKALVASKSENKYYHETLDKLYKELRGKKDFGIRPRFPEKDQSLIKVSNFKYDFFHEPDYYLITDFFEDMLSPYYFPPDDEDLFFVHLEVLIFFYVWLESNLDKINFTSLFLLSLPTERIIHKALSETILSGSIKGPNSDKSKKGIKIISTRKRERKTLVASAFHEKQFEDVRLNKSAMVRDRLIGAVLKYRIVESALLKPGIKKKEIDALMKLLQSAATTEEINSLKKMVSEMIVTTATIRRDLQEEGLL